MSIRNNGYWPYYVEIGDILISGRGTERVVRGVSYGPNGRPTHVDFAILRCSWTRRALTCLNYVDLQYQGYRPTGKRIELPTTKLDAQLAADTEYGHPPILHCCDVIGVVR